MALNALKQQEDQGEIRLYYFDEAGWNLVPCVPYAWQPVGETREIPSAHAGKRINALGFLSRKGDFYHHHQEGTVTSNVVIEAFDRFVEHVPKDKPVWVVLDNASIHTAKVVQEKRTLWEKSGIQLKYLPPYSPELNLIEILWKHMKYFWLGFSAYMNFHTLKNQVISLLENIGKKYQITFV